MKTLLVNWTQRKDTAGGVETMYEYLKETGIMDRFSKSIKATSYGLPRESQAKIGLPNDLPANIKLIVPPKEFKL